MTRYSRSHMQKGEVSSLLTIVAMVAIAFGLILGSQVTTSEQAVNVPPRAQETAPLAAVTIPPEGVDQHDEVCYPGGDEDQQVRDQYCRTRMFPELITRDIIDRADTSAKRLFNRLFVGTEQTINNPLIVKTTEADPRTFNFYGGLCLNRSSLGNTSNGRNFSTEDVEVYISAAGVNKFVDERTGQIGIGSKDKSYALRYKMAASEDRGGELVVARSNQEVCTFGNGKVEPTPGAYTNDDNPLLFNITATKQAILQQINRAKDEGQFDEDSCGIYVHLRENIQAGRSNNRGAIKPKDTYNIYKIDLRDILTEEELADICPPEVTPTPTKTDEPTLTPTGTDTPSSTPSPTPPQAACWEPCTINTVCGKDPIGGKQMNCYAVNFGGSIPILPTNPIDLDTGEQDDPFSVTSPCTTDRADGSCLCLPQRCENNPIGCSSKPLACDPDSPKITPTSAPSITPSPTPEEEAQSCEFKALAYFQECEQENIDENGNCQRRTEGKGIGEFRGVAIDQEELNENFGASNNKQIREGRYGDKPATPWENGAIIGFIRSITSPENFPIIGDLFDFPITYIFHQSKFETNADTDVLAVGSEQDLTAAGRTKNPILFSPRLPDENTEIYEREQYYNFEDASVRAIFDPEQYRIVPDGNEILECENGLKDTTIGNCDYAEFEANRVNPDVREENRDPRDTIAGLTVGCGQKILYGWTVEKCIQQNLDMVLVVDTSSSTLDRTTADGRVIISAMTDSVRDFMANLQTEFPNVNRIGVVQFNATGEIRQPLVDVTDANVAKIIARLDSKTDPLLTGSEFTSIDLGLGKANEMFSAPSSADNMKLAVLLSDGQVNPKHDGNPAPGHFEEGRLRDIAVSNAMKEAGIRVMSIGYGKGSSDIYSGEHLARLASTDEFNSSLLFDNPDDSTFTEIYAQIDDILNSCDLHAFQYNGYIRSMDINGDGVINTIDLFLIYDNYFARGQDVPEDLNADQVVNSLDVSIIVNNIGTVVPQASNTDQETLGDIFN